ncbi:MAG: TPM domain-containing protein [Candidatus Absconditabacterales bacterium]
MIKSIFKNIIFLGLLIVGSVFAQEQINPMSFPLLTSFVSDFSNVLTQQELIQLNTIAKNYQDKTSNQIVTVLFPNRLGNELIDIGVDIFAKNGIGQKDKNNGLLLMISTEEKKIRIAVGYGLEGIIPDITASNIIENDIRSYVNSGDFYQAINNFYAKSIEIIDAGGDSNYPTNLNTQKKSDYFIFIIIGFLIGSGISALLKKSKKLEISKNSKIKKIQSFSNLIGFGIIIFLSITGLILVLNTILLLIISIIVGFFLSFGGRSGGIGFRGGGLGGGGGGGFGGGFSGGGGGFGGGGGGD